MCFPSPTGCPIRTCSWSWTDDALAMTTTPVAELLALGLCCPRCRGEVTGEDHADAPALFCARCSVHYPIILGIPDLRVFPDPYIGIEEDRAKGRLLAAYGAGRDWADLASHYYEITRDTVPPSQARQFAAGLGGALPRALSALETWEQLTDEPLAASDRVIDVGCGTAPLLVAAGGRSAARVGVDIAFRWLVIGKLRLANAGVHAHLVCACAEALPFRDGAFDVYVTQGTVENVRDQAMTVQESRRVLRDGGQLWISTANRTSLGPDPHLGLPAGGLLPSRAVAAWARRRGALPPQRRLLSLAGLRSLLRQGAFERARFGVPAIPAATRGTQGAILRAAIGAYGILRGIGALRSTLLVVGPTLLATARKPPARVAA